MKHLYKHILCLVFIYLLFAPAILSLPFETIAPALALILLIVSLFFSWGTGAFLFALWLMQLAVMGMCSGLFYLLFYLIFLVVIGILSVHERRRKLISLLICAFGAWLVLSTLMTTLPYLLKEILLPFTLFSAASCLLLGYLPVSYFENRFTRLLTLLLLFTIPVVIETKITQRVSVPSPAQSLVVSVQKGVDVLLPAWKLPGGVRLFAHTDTGYLVMLDKPSYKFWRHIDNNIFYISKLDKKGNAIEKPFQANYSIDNFLPSPFHPDKWYVLSLNRKNICLLDVRNWLVIQCTDFNDMHDRIALSPNNKYLAGNVDRNSNLYIYDAKTLKVLARVDKSRGGCRTGISLVFIDDAHLVEGCLEGGEFFLIEYDGKNKAAVIDSFEVTPGMGKALALAYVAEKNRLIMFESFRIWARLYDIKQRRQIKKKLFLPSFRWIERIGHRDLWSVCGALGLVHIIDSDLNVKKTFYCGNKIKSMVVDGDKIYLASQAGLIEIDLAKVEL